MVEKFQLLERRTSADVVFETLYAEITSMSLLPGTRISEAEIAARFDLSRQPVRDAFSRLGNLGFLLIRPQKATEVQKFSLAAMVSARFIRAAIEVEVVTRAVEVWDGSLEAEFEASLAEQDQAVKNNDLDAFQKLDYDFHRALCDAAGASYAFDSIRENKAQIDRLCVLSTLDNDTMATLVQDHRNIFEAIARKDAEEADTQMRLHLDRLSETIDQVHQSHPDYFV